MHEVPRGIAQCPCYYLFEDEMGRPSDFLARRIKEPKEIVLNNHDHNPLCPGIMIGFGENPIQDGQLLTSSGISPAYITQEAEVENVMETNPRRENCQIPVADGYRSTRIKNRSAERNAARASSVLVKDGNGNEYMTVASRGFPSGTKVFDPVDDQQEIGEVITEFPHADVALVRLHGARFANEVFENTFGEETPIRSRQFEGSENGSIGDYVLMSNPFMGYGEGTYGPWSESRIPSDNPHEPAHKWIRTRWVYLGQGFSQHMVDGVCGSAMWNERGSIVGFVQYAPASGQFKDWCLTVAANYMTERGFSIV